MADCADTFNQCMLACKCPLANQGPVEYRILPLVANQLVALFAGLPHANRVDQEAIAAVHATVATLSTRQDGCAGDRAGLNNNYVLLLEGRGRSPHRLFPHPPSCHLARPQHSWTLDTADGHPVQQSCRESTVTPYSTEPFRPTRRADTSVVRLTSLHRRHGPSPLCYLSSVMPRINSWDKALAWDGR